MTDRTENHRLFDDVKILNIAALSLIINYAFIIGTNILAVFMDNNWDLEPNPKCVKINGFAWMVILNFIHITVLTIAGICADIALHRYVSIIPQCSLTVSWSGSLCSYCVIIIFYFKVKAYMFLAFILFNF